jgi:hypothetical protein
LAKGPSQPPVAPVFLPVRVVETDLAPPQPAPLIEIVLHSGPVVRVPCGFDPRTLKGIDPFAYLQDVLHRLPATPAGQLDELLPDVWFATHSSARRKTAA